MVVYDEHGNMRYWFRPDDKDIRSFGNSSALNIDPSAMNKRPGMVGFKSTKHIKRCDYSGFMDGETL